MDAHHSRIEAIGLIACLLVGAVLRLAVITMRPEQLTDDRDVYLGIATSVVEGRGFCSPGSTTATAFRPPLYPLILAGGMSFFRPAAVVGAVNVLSGLLTVLFTASIGSHLGLGWRRFVAAALVAIDPLLVVYTAQPMTESLCTFLATLWLWTMVRLRTVRHPVEAIYPGIAIGLLVLCRPTFWLIAGLYGLVLFIQLRTISTNPNQILTRRVWLSRAWLAGGTLLIVLPWVVRNWVFLGVPILTTTHGGYTLQLGNNPVFDREVVQQPWGTVWEDKSLLKWQIELDQQIEHDLGVGATEVERDRWHSQQARQFIRDYPQSFFHAVVHRMRSLWTTVPQGDSDRGSSRWLTRLVSWYYGIVLTAGCLGLVIVGRSQDRKQWVPLYLLIASVQLAHLVYWTNARMRAPLTPATALFAVVAIPARNRMTFRPNERDLI
jgi:hypothetical protein